MFICCIHANTYTSSASVVWPLRCLLLKYLFVYGSPHHTTRAHTQAQERTSENRKSTDFPFSLSVTFFFFIVALPFRLCHKIRNINRSTFCTNNIQQWQSAEMAWRIKKELRKKKEHAKQNVVNEKCKYLKSKL